MRSARASCPQGRAAARILAFAALFAALAASRAPACADEASGYDRAQACIRSASPCDALECIDRFAAQFPKSHEAEIASTRKRKATACAAERRERAAATLRRCLDGRAAAGDAATPDARRMCTELATSGATGPLFTEELAMVNHASAPAASVPHPSADRAAHPAIRAAVVADGREATRPLDAPATGSTTGGVEPPPTDAIAASPPAGRDVEPQPTAGPSSARNAPHGCGRPGALGTAREAVVDAPEGGLRIGLESYDKTLDLADKEVALTFDDGPNPGTTERVLDALEAECVKATFFLVGRNALAHSDLVRREIHAGHTIGNHSWSHPARTLAGIPERDAIREIERGFAAIDTAAHGESDKGSAPRTSWFRFPGFADTDAALAWLDDRRITVFGTDFWAADWVSMSPEAELDLVMRHLHEKGRGIVLFHDTRGQTAKMMPMFLRRLKDEGYRIVHLVPGPGSETKIRSAPSGWKSETKEIVSRIMPRLRKLPPYSADETGAATR